MLLYTAVLILMHESNEIWLVIESSPCLQRRCFRGLLRVPVTAALLVLGAAISHELAAVTWQRCAELRILKPVKISSKEVAETGGSDLCALKCK